MFFKVKLENVFKSIHYLWPFCGCSRRKLRFIMEQVVDNELLYLVVITKEFGKAVGLQYVTILLKNFF